MESRFSPPWSTGWSFPTPARQTSGFDGIAAIEGDRLTIALSQTVLGAAWFARATFPSEGFKLGQKAATEQFVEFCRSDLGDGRSGAYARAKDVAALCKVWRDKHGDPDAMDKHGNRNAFWAAIYDAEDTGAIVAAVIDEVRKLATPKGRDTASQQGLRAALYPERVKAEVKADKASDKKAELQRKADEGSKPAQRAVETEKTKTREEKIAANLEKVKSFMTDREKVDSETATGILIHILNMRPDMDLIGISAKIEGLIDEKAKAAGLEPAEDEAA